MGLYGVCSIAAACCAVAVALYWGEEAPANDQPVALVTSADAPSLVSHATATPTPASPAIAPAAAGPAKDETGDSTPMWRPILDATANLFATASAHSPPTPEPTPASPTLTATGAASAKGGTGDSPPMWQPIVDAAANLFGTASAGSPPTQEPTPAPRTISETALPPAAAASAPPTATPMGPIATAEAPPSEGTAAVPASNPAGAAPNADVAEAGPTTPPIWTTERKTTRKVTKATPPVRRDAPAAANVVAMRNDGYAALQERRYREALILLQHATMMGDPYAPMYIGQIFEKGFGVPRDVGQASYWYGIAIDRGNGAALAAFNRMRVNPY